MDSSKPFILKDNTNQGVARMVRHETDAKHRPDIDRRMQLHLAG
jgi:hypothetical protein